MANKNTLLVIGVALLSGMVCALLTVLVLRPDPWANLETARAGAQDSPGGGMIGDELVAVPLRKDNGNGDYLCVIAKTNHKSLIPDAGNKDELVMVVCDMRGDELQIRAIRPIQYELQGRKVYGNGGDCEPARSGSQQRPLSSKELADGLKKE